MAKKEIIPCQELLPIVVWYAQNAQHLLPPKTMMILQKKRMAACGKALEGTGAKRVAFVSHLKIRDPDGYGKWLGGSKNSFNGKRLFRVKADPVAREGMVVDEIVIDEFSSIKDAFEFISAFDDTLRHVCSEYTVLVIIPEPSSTFYLVRGISWLVRLFKGVTDKGTPAAAWKA